MEYLNLNKICRACLLERDNMKRMTDLCNQKSLMEMFVAVTNVEVHEVDLPQLCDQCEEKLNLSYSFREQCQRSNEILLNYVAADNKVIEAGDGQNTKEIDITLEGSDGERNADPCEPNRRSKRRKAKQSLRLSQFSYDEVNQAIEDARKKFFENTECIRCGFIGSNARALSVHISHLHKDLKEHWCMHCNGEFDDLEEHLKLHGDVDLKCQFCEKVFHAKGHLTEHLRSHSGVRPYKCDFCEKCFISQRHLKVHLRIHTNERPYQCQLCPRAFIQQTSLKSHLKQHEKGGAANTKEESQEGLENGSEKLAVVAQNYCSDCDRKVRSLSLHRRQVHSDGIKILNEYGDNVANNKLCTVCGKQFKNSSKLRVHMRVHTGEAPYKCSFCGKRVTTRNQLVVHERIHTGEKPHVCHVCGKGFAQSSVLNTHMKLHTGRPEVCQICDQRFCRPAELKLHMRKHTGEKPFLCTECGQAFIQRSHLVEHNKTHSDDRPFQCSYCTKAFKQNSSLKSHVQIHLGWKPFKCSQCSYACRQSYSLTQHMKQHEVDAPRPDRPHACLLCSKSFTTVAMLTSHTNSVHNVNNALLD